MGEHEDDAAALEAAQRAAENKAAALHTVGWEVGAGAAVWARAIQDQLALHESTRERFAANTVDREAFERLHGTTLMLVIAIDQVRVFADQVRALTDDADLARAHARFDATFPDVKVLRDLVAHLDEYAVGKGRRQTGKQLRRQTGKPLPAISEQNVTMLVYWPDDRGTILELGKHYIDLRRAAGAAVDLARVVERVRAEHLTSTEREANEALRRRYGLPPDQQQSGD